MWNNTNKHALRAVINEKALFDLLTTYAYPQSNTMKCQSKEGESVK